MNEHLELSIDYKLLKLAGHLAGICKRKKIEVIDDNTFVLNDRRLILDYSSLTGDYNGFFKNMINGKAILNELQMGEYQRKDFRRNLGKSEFSLEVFLYTDFD